MKVDVIIPMHNEENTIKEVLDAVLSQDYDNFRVIVVDDASTDKSSEIVKNFLSKYENLQYIKNEKNIGLAASLNKVMKQSNADIVVSLHADCVPPKNWLKVLTKHFIDDSIAVVIPVIVPEVNDLNFVNKVFACIYENLAPKKTNWEQVRHFDGKADAFRLKAIKEAGFFDETFKNAGEDGDLFMKLTNLGYKTIVAPIQVIHKLSSHQRGIVKNLAKAIQYSEQEVILFKRYKTGTNINNFLSLILIFFSALLTLFLTDMYIILFTSLLAVLFGLYYKKFFIFLGFIIPSGIICSIIFFNKIIGWCVFLSGYLLFCLAIGLKYMIKYKKLLGFNLAKIFMGSLIIACFEFLKSIGFLRGLIMYRGVK